MFKVILKEKLTTNYSGLAIRITNIIKMFGTHVFKSDTIQDGGVHDSKQAWGKSHKVLHSERLND